MNKEKQTHFAAIAFLTNSLGDVGKIKMQKLVYFAQQVYGVPLNYVFKMHYFGPYSEELDDDILDMKLYDYLTVAPDPDGYGYHITPGEEGLAEEDASVSRYKQQLERCIEELGDYDARTLELLATLHFVQQVKKGQSKSVITSTVAMLKPKFDRQQIEYMYDYIPR